MIAVNKEFLNVFFECLIPFRRILFNLLPSHVATHFLDNQFRSNMVRCFMENIINY